MKSLHNKFTSVVIACDHAGLSLQNALIPFLSSMQLSITNLGVYSSEPADYPDIAHSLCHFMHDNQVGCFGILSCGSGIGMSIVANRHQFIRAALCVNETYAALARAHNDANVLTLGGRLITPTQAQLIIHAFCNTDFEGGRHIARIKKL